MFYLTLSDFLEAKDFDFDSKYVDKKSKQLLVVKKKLIKNQLVKK